MEAIYKLKANEIGINLMKTIKELFKGKEVIITISTECDETEYLNASSANREHLEKSIASEPYISFNEDEFEKHVESLLNDSDK